MAQITDKVLNESDVPEALRFEAVAHAWFDQQVFGAGRIGLEFAAAGLSPVYHQADSGQNFVSGI